MANNLNLNPIVIDTFSATFTLKEKGVGAMTITKIIFFSADAADVFALEDGDGNQIIIAAQDASLGKQIDFGKNGQVFNNGLVFDHDDSLQVGLSSGDYVLIYTR